MYRLNVLWVSCHWVESEILLSCHDRAEGLFVSSLAIQFFPFPGDDPIRALTLPLEKAKAPEVKV